MVKQKGEYIPTRVNSFGEEEPISCPCFFDGDICERVEGDCKGVIAFEFVKGGVREEQLKEGCCRFRDGVPKYTKFKVHEGFWWGLLSTSNSWVRLASVE